MKPDVSSPYNNQVVFSNDFEEDETLAKSAESIKVKKILSRRKKVSPKRASKSRSHSRRNCKACNDLAKMSLKANPMKNENQE